MSITKKGGYKQPLTLSNPTPPSQRHSGETGKIKKPKVHLYLGTTYTICGLNHDKLDLPTSTYLENITCKNCLKCVMPDQVTINNMNKAKKLKKCPRCGESNLGDFWQKGRKLKQVCREYECSWEGKARTPEKHKIKPTKVIPADQFSGYSYNVFDKYGHILISSRSYDTRARAKSELLKDMERGKTDKNAGPYTGVLWPSTVKVTGEVFK